MGRIGHSRQGIVCAKAQGCKLEMRSGHSRSFRSGVPSLELGIMGKGCGARQGPKLGLWSGK